jgi:hypothetical protein
VSDLSCTPVLIARALSVASEDSGSAGPRLRARYYHSARLGAACAAVVGRGAAVTAATIPIILPPLLARTAALLSLLLGAASTSLSSDLQAGLRSLLGLCAFSPFPGTALRSGCGPCRREGRSAPSRTPLVLGALRRQSPTEGAPPAPDAGGRDAEALREEGRIRELYLACICGAGGVEPRTHHCTHDDSVETHVLVRSSLDRGARGFAGQLLVYEQGWEGDAG